MRAMRSGRTSGVLLAELLAVAHMWIRFRFERPNLEPGTEPDLVPESLILQRRDGGAAVLGLAAFGLFGATWSVMPIAAGTTTLVSGTPLC